MSNIKNTLKKPVKKILDYKPAEPPSRPDKQPSVDELKTVYKYENGRLEEPNGCVNCSHCKKMIGLGLGYMCDEPRNEVDRKMFTIPYRYHCCDYYSGA